MNLLPTLERGTVVYTVLRPPSRSGRTSLYGLYVQGPDGLRSISEAASAALGLRWEGTGLRTRLSPSELIETLSRAVYSDPTYLNHFAL